MRELIVDDDGSIRAVGNRPLRDQYTLKFPTVEGKLAALRLDVPEQQDQNFVLSQVKATWSPNDKASNDARFVRIELPGDNRILHVAEIEVFNGNNNIALRAKVTQSSTGFGGQAERAIDGNTDGNYNENSVSHTNQQTNPWIEVDLGSQQRIDRVKLWNRTDGGKAIGDRIRGLRLSLLNEDRAAVWHQESAEFPEASQVYRPDGEVEFRFVEALADFHQDGFPAATVLGAKIDSDQGWAVAPQTGHPHQLMLSLGDAFDLSEGELKIQMVHASKHKRLPLDHFRWSWTDDEDVAKRSQIPAEVRSVIRTETASRSPEERETVGGILSQYHTTVGRVEATIG